MLKPYISYIEKVDGGTDGEYIINYTLDNYITIYGKFDGEYGSRSGYLNVINDDSCDYSISIQGSNFKEKDDITPASIEGIKFGNQEMKPEKLSEVIAYKVGNNTYTQEFNYVYEAEKNTKVYYNTAEDKFFILDRNLNIVYVENLTEPLYKKVTIPCDNGEESYIKTYKSLANGDWYIKDDSGKYIKVDQYDGIVDWTDMLYDPSITDKFTDKTNDFSAINYCVETYVFTKMVNETLDLSYIGGEDIKINKNNDPEKEDSEFTQHKKEVMKNLIMENLGQAITSYSENNEQKYQLPILNETEWDQVLSNISAISFVQNIPIGLKYYNNYAIATSTFNKEFVDPDELYFYDKNETTSDKTYHLPYCKKINTDTNLIGYRSIESIYKDYENGDDTNYYFMHVTDNHITKIDQSCYYCLVQRDLYEKEESENRKTAYYTALARERYLQLESINITGPDMEVTKTVSPNISVDYGQTVEYTITITNNGPITDYIFIEDSYETDQVTISGFDYSENASSETISELTNNYESKYEGSKTLHRWNKIKIASGQKIIIKYSAVITGNIGTIVTNTAKVHYDEGRLEKASEASTNTMIVKNVTTDSYTEMDAYNIVLVLDHSTSMDGNGRLNSLYKGVYSFLNSIVEIEDGYINTAAEYNEILARKKIKLIIYKIRWKC